MRIRWTSLALAAAILGCAAPAYAQYLVNSPESAPPMAEPLPYGPSTADGPPSPPYPPPNMGGGNSCNVLPENTPNISTPLPMPCDPVRWYSKVDYLHWWMKADHLDQTLVTTTNNANPATRFGAIGQTGTAVIAGDGYANAGPMDGVRWTFGVNPDCFVPLEVTGFYVHTSSSTFVGSNSAGRPLLARAIFSLDPAVLQESVYLSSFPLLASGTVGITTTTALYGAEVNGYVCHLCGSPDQHGFILDLTVGARYAALNEDLDILNSIRSQSPLLAVSFLGSPFGTGFTTAVQDLVRTRNQFYGGQVGARTCFPICNWLNLEMKADVGVGVNQQILSVMGATTLYSPTATAPFLTPAPVVAGGGIQAVASNSGRFTRERVSTISDLGVSLNVPVLDWLSLSFGYDLFVWTQVARPGAQLSRYIDTRQVPSDSNFTPGVAATQPGPMFNETSFYAQGLTISLAIQY
jgi:hypothetical protein